MDVEAEQLNVELFCETGTIGRVSELGVAKIDANNENQDYFEDTFCEIEQLNSNQLNFEDLCYE